MAALLALIGCCRCLSRPRMPDASREPGFPGVRAAEEGESPEGTRAQKKSKWGAKAELVDPEL